MHRQDLEPQTAALQAGCREIIEEKASGGDRSCPELAQLSVTSAAAIHWSGYAPPSPHKGLRGKPVLQDGEG
jgi:hypothetical protein